MLSAQIFRYQRLLLTVFGAQLLLHVLFATQVLGQSQETINERHEIQIMNQDRRLGMIEGEMDREGIAARVRVLESDMYEVKWLARGMVLAVFGQLVVSGLSLNAIRRGGGRS